VLGGTYKMVIEKSAEEALLQLLSQRQTQVYVGEYLITIRNFDNKLTFSTPVFLGEKYIPISVRGCLFEKFPEQTIKTNLSVDELNYTVNLHYQGSSEGIDFGKFKDLLEEFAQIADLWCSWLDDHDRRDYAYVRRR
jgi:hypothetical protein